MRYFALVRDKQTRELNLLIRDNYSSKRDFKSDIRANGFELVRNFIYNEKQWDEIQSTDNSELSNRLERRKFLKKVNSKIRRDRKKFNKRLGL